MKLKNNAILSVKYCRPPKFFGGIIHSASQSDKMKIWSHAYVCTLNIARDASTSENMPSRPVKNNNRNLINHG